MYVVVAIVDIDDCVFQWTVLHLILKWTISSL